LSKIILHDYWRSTASYRVRIALNLVNLDYESRPVDLVLGEQKSEDHIALNSQGFVPVLEIDGLKLTQSLAIVEYLNETRTLNLLPDAPAERAHLRSLAQIIACDIHPVCNGGEKPSLADICLIPQLYNARRWSSAYDDLKTLCAVEEACLNLKAFQDAAPNQP